MQQRWSWLQAQWTRYKHYVYTTVFMAALACLGEALYRHWQAVSAIQITPASWACLAMATGVTLFAVIWTGWVWGWILRDLGHPVSLIWAAQVHLKTNIAKYLPSNLVHFYGRTLGATDIGVPLGPAFLSVILDTMLMAAAGLIVALLSVPRQGLLSAGLGLVTMLVVLHPSILGRIINLLGQRLKRQQPEQEMLQMPLKRYPLRPLLGELGFVLLKGLGFVLVVVALTPIQLQMVPSLISIYSTGWLLGFVTPGVPGGLGIVELTVSTLLSRPGVLTSEQVLPFGLALAAVGVHRLCNTLAETMGAMLATLDTKLPDLIGRSPSPPSPSQPSPSALDSK